MAIQHSQIMGGKALEFVMAKVEPGMEAMVDVYIFETTTLLEQLDDILLRTEKANEFTEEDINEIFRIMHTVKGSSAMMGFENLQTLAHKGEDMFFIIRESPDKVADIAFVYDLVFQMSDLFKAEIDSIQNDDDYEPTDFSEMISKLQDGAKILKGEMVAGASSAPAGGAPAAAPVAPAKSFGEGCASVRVFFEDGCKMENIRAFMLLTMIKEQAEVVDYNPSDIETNSESANFIIDNGFVVTFRSEDNSTILQLIENALNVQSYEVINNEPEKKPQPAQATASAQQTAAPAQQKPKAGAPKSSDKQAGSSSGKAGAKRA